MAKVSLRAKILLRRRAKPVAALHSGGSRNVDFFSLLDTYVARLDLLTSGKPKAKAISLSFKPVKAWAFIKIFFFEL